MKGLVLAGGSGKRLRPLSYSGPKQLVPIANRPVLFHALEQLAGAGIHEVAIVVAPATAAAVQAAAGSGAAFGLGLSYVVQDRPGGLAHAVASARGFLGEDPFCMFLGDNVIGSELRPYAERFAADSGAAASLLLKAVDDPSAFGVAELDGKGELLRLVEKPARPPSRLALTGVTFFRAGVHAAIEKIRPSARGELEIADAVGELLAEGERVRVERLEAFWFDTGHQADLLAANEAVLDAWGVRELRGVVDGDSVVEGRVSIASGARVTRSKITGPVAIDCGAVIEDAEIGPFSSVGADCTVARSRVERSLLLEGCRVEGIGRLKDSVLGRRVTVQCRTGVRPALSLWLGDDCRVEL